MSSLNEAAAKEGEGEEVEEKEDVCRQQKL